MAVVLVVETLAVAAEVLEEMHLLFLHPQELGIYQQLVVPGLKEVMEEQGQVAAMPYVRAALVLMDTPVAVVLEIAVRKQFLVLLAVAMVVFWITDLRIAAEFPHLLLAVAFLTRTLASLGIVCLAGQSFLISGAPGLLLLGCGVAIWGISGFLATFTLTNTDANFGVTISNLGLWLAAVCHLTGVLLALPPQRVIRRPGWWLSTSYPLALASVGWVAWLTFAHRLPVFFVDGQGGTMVRHVVLGLALAMFAVTASLLWKGNRRVPSTFVFWYTLALLLIVIGVAGMLLQSSRTSLLNWSCRLTQYLSGIYMLMAASAALREARGPAAITLTPTEAGATKAWLTSLWRQAPVQRLARYGGAMAAVTVAYGLRLAAEACFGTGLPTYITFYPAVMSAAVLGGFGPGLLATVFSGCIAGYWILPPAGEFAISSPVDRLGLVIFAGMGLFMSVVAEFYRRDRAKVAAFERAAALRETEEVVRRQAELIDPVRAKLIAEEMLRVVRDRQSPTPVPAAASWLERVPAVAGGVVALTGAVVLLGWIFDLAALKSVLPGLATMKANTALCFLLAGVALVGRDRRWVRLACAGLVCAVAGLTLVEYGTGRDLGIDQFLFRDTPNPQTIFLGRMVQATALGFVLGGAALLLLRAPRTRSLQQALALATGLIGLVGVLGYLYGVAALYRFAGYSSMARCSRRGWWWRAAMGWPACCWKPAPAATWPGGFCRW